MAVPNRRDHRRRRARSARSKALPQRARSRSAPATSASTGCAPTRHLSAQAADPLDLRADPAARGGQLVNWWEGNLAYRARTARSTPATPAAAPTRSPRTGRSAGSAPGGHSVWTTPAFGQGTEAGNTFWGSVDLYAFSLDPAGQPRWQTFTPRLRHLLAGARLRRDRLRRLLRPQALRARPGHRRGPLELPDRRPHLQLAGARRRLGRPHQRDLHRARPTARSTRFDPIGQPALALRHRRPGALLAGAGQEAERRRPDRLRRLLQRQALRARRRQRASAAGPSTRRRGTRRSADRNDLNGSPALGRRGVYIGGEHGRVWFVPYDYCLHHRDPRCEPQAGPGVRQERRPDVLRHSRAGPPCGRREGLRIPPATVLATRLIVRKRRVDRGRGAAGRRTSDAAGQRQAAVRFTTQLSGDGHYLFIRPTGLLRPNTRYRVRIARRLAGRAAPGPTPAPSTRPSASAPRRSRGKLPLAGGGSASARFSISRLALPLPPLLPSVNQIGFDSYDLIAGTLARTKAEPQWRGRAAALGDRRAPRSAWRAAADPPATSSSRSRALPRRRCS